jgi:hypothetical protein
VAAFFLTPDKGNKEFMGLQNVTKGKSFVL